jgi:hypothetical protein
MTPRQQLTILRAAGDDLRLVWVSLLTGLDVNADPNLLEAMTGLGTAMERLERVKIRTQLEWTNQRLAERAKEQSE